MTSAISLLRREQKRFEKLSDPEGSQMEASISACMAALSVLHDLDEEPPTVRRALGILKATEATWRGVAASAGREVEKELTPAADRLKVAVDLLQRLGKVEAEKSRPPLALRKFVAAALRRSSKRGAAVTGSRLFDVYLTFMNRSKARPLSRDDFGRYMGLILEGQGICKSNSIADPAGKQASGWRGVEVTETWRDARPNTLLPFDLEATA